MRSSLAKLPKDHRGIPIPWFVTEKKSDGTWDFVRVHPDRSALAVRQNRCWVCGDPMINVRSFVCGPLSVATGSVAEPPMHLDCARFAVRVCPFMTNPNYQRSFHGVVPGVQITRNPAVSCIYVTHDWEVEWTLRGLLFTVKNPHRLEAYKEGRSATVEEYRESLNLGYLHALQKPEIAAQPQFRQAFADAVTRALALPLATPPAQGAP